MSVTTTRAWLDNVGGVACILVSLCQHPCTMTPLHADTLTQVHPYTMTRGQHCTMTA
jgi:hypothetical protein